MDNHITFTKQSLKEFKRLYEGTKPGETFVFQGHEVLHDYAKYVIEYVEGKINHAVK
jgi:hypothetical protein